MNKINDQNLKCWKICFTLYILFKNYTLKLNFFLLFLYCIYLCINMCGKILNYKGKKISHQYSPNYNLFKIHVYTIQFFCATNILIIYY